MVLKFCTNVAKGLKIKVKKFERLTLAFEEITGKRQVGGGCFCPSHAE